MGESLGVIPFLWPCSSSGHVILWVFHFKIMRKLQQLLFLGTRRKGDWGQKETGYCSALGGSSGHSKDQGWQGKLGGLPKKR